MLCRRILAASHPYFRRRSLSLSLPHNDLLFQLFSSIPQPQTTGMAAHPKDEKYLEVVIPKRIALFKSFKAQQLSHRQSIPADPIKIQCQQLLKLWWLQL